jgi:tetratricopeptide (TPR) repeat protein
MMEYTDRTGRRILISRESALFRLKDPGDAAMPDPPERLPQTISHVPSGAWNPEASTAPPVSHVSAIDPALLARRPWRVGEVFLDDFEVEGVLGQGGMGTVYLVRQLASDRRLAAKRARLALPDARRRFLAELQLWMDLPEHPHLAPCRFFRTVEDEVVIFSDLATGGSLADWITQGRLRRLADVLDIAVQVARGLHALHERGLVHQDVKPANVLMASDGLARVADFGLARARARFSQPAAAGEGQSVLVTGGAMTPAYCSPEQAFGKAVSRKTDVWSWGVLVLEMFVGKVPCCEKGGASAGEVLQRYLQSSDSHIERMPASVAAVVQLCLSAEPGERWPNLAEASLEMARAYRHCLGADYPRAWPDAEPAGEGELAPLDRQASGPGRWESPRKWLTRAFQAAGRDVTEAEAILPPPAASRRAQAVADLSAYEEARGMLERLVGDGQEDLRPQLTALCVQKALVHSSVGDWPGARELFDRALQAWGELVGPRKGWGRRELTPWLVRTCLLKAQALRGLGEHDEAVALCDRVMALWGGLDNRRRRREMRADLAAAQLEKGLVLRDRGDRRAALPLLDQAIGTWRQLVEQEGQTASANDLAQALMARAGVLSSLGQFREALEQCDQAIALRQRLVRREGRRDLEGDLARAYVTRANVLRAREDPRASLPHYEQAVALYEGLIEDGRDDLTTELARACIAHGHALRVLGEPARAAGLCERAVTLLERLVHQEGRSDLQHELARAYLQQANGLRLAGQAGVALCPSDQAVAVWERLVHREGRAGLSNDLARAYVGKAAVLRELRQWRTALALYDQAIALRESLPAREDVVIDIARDRVSRAELLAEMGDVERARAEVGAAGVVLQDAVNRLRRGDLRGMLTRARRLQSRLGDLETGDKRQERD